MNGTHLNKEWHLKHRMPEKATLDQRLEWHLEHVKHCGCRPLPLKVAQELGKRGLTPPVRPRRKDPRALSARTHVDNLNDALLAPCGMHCAVCSGYLAYRNHIPKQKGKIVHCAGCRARGKQCTYLKGECFLIRTDRVKYCFQCPTFPCDRLKHSDERYRRSFGASLIKNLLEIKEHGEKAFLENQQQRFGCGKCGRLKSVHSGKCFVCEEISSWKD